MGLSHYTDAKLDGMRRVTSQTLEHCHKPGDREAEDNRVLVGWMERGKYSGGRVLDLDVKGI